MPSLEDHVNAPAETEAPLMISVSGVRGIVGKTMTPTIATEFAATYGTYVRETTGAARPKLCVGRDSRTSGAMLSRSVVAGLLSVGCEVVDLGIEATPTIGIMIPHHRAHGGVVITASHNPAPWNGLKFLDADGCAPVQERAEAIIERLRERRITYVDAESIATATADETGGETHVARVLEHIDPEHIRAAWFKVVLDSGSGAGGAVGRKLLDELRCELVQLHEEPTGVFARGPEPLAENLEELAQVTAEREAAVGFAQDPDADRLAIVDERGRYIGEEYTLALAVKFLLEPGTNSVLAANLSTSRMIDDLAREAGASVVRTAVGEANVAAALRRAEHALVGGEGNGGVIFPAVGWVRDSVASMAIVLALMAREGRPLSAIVDDLPRYSMIKQKVDLSAVGGRAAVAPALERVIAAYDADDLNTADGVRVDLEQGWVHLRPSNTEPILRLIAEANDEDAALALIREISLAAGL